MAPAINFLTPWRRRFVDNCRNKSFLSSQAYLFFFLYVNTVLVCILKMQICKPKFFSFILWDEKHLELLSLLLKAREHEIFFM